MPPWDIFGVGEHGKIPRCAADWIRWKYRLNMTMQPAEETSPRVDFRRLLISSAANDATSWNPCYRCAQQQRVSAPDGVSTTTHSLSWFRVRAAALQPPFPGQRWKPSARRKNMTRSTAIMSPNFRQTFIRSAENEYGNRKTILYYTNKEKHRCEKCSIRLEKYTMSCTSTKGANNI